MSVAKDLLAALPSRRFGRLGWMVRPIGLGGAWLRGRRGEKSLEEGAETVLAALKLGVDFIDTSIRYGDSELVLGLALAEVPADQRPYLATKSQVIQDGDIADGVYRSCQESLSRLRLEQVDLFQIHEVECYGYDKIMGAGGALEGLRRAQAAGLCTGIGVTGRPPDLLVRLVETGEFDSVLTYYEYDLVTAEATKALLPAAERHDVGVIGGSPARMGMFSRPDERRWQHHPEPVRARVPKLEALLGKPVHEMADDSIRYLFADERVHTLVIGSSGVESLISSIRAALAGPLEEPVLGEVRRLSGWMGPGSNGRAW
ncbi:MAG: aldo/keto reductase [Armatimonadetes bacterium]|nr:aldo/keto reductase [Armatimonadota bacterium]